MPTYEYECGACAHRFEQFQPMNSKPVRVCPACGKRRVERLIGTGGGFIFKGSGFYQTDYRSDSYQKAAQAEKGPPAEATAGKAEKKASESPAAGSQPVAETKPSSGGKSTPKEAPPAQGESSTARGRSGKQREG